MACFELIASLSQNLRIYDQSFAVDRETTSPAENAQRIHWGFFASVVMADQMIFHKIADPNIRLQSSAYVKADAVTYAQGDAQAITETMVVSSGRQRSGLKTNPQVSFRHCNRCNCSTTTTTGSEQEKERDALEELNSLIGLEKVKHEIKNDQHGRI